MKRLLLAAACVAVLAMAGSANASTGSLTVTGNTVGGTLTVSGCGFKTPRDVSVYLYKEGSTTELVGMAWHTDATGCFSINTGYTFADPGDYEVEAFLIKPHTGPGSYNENHPDAYLDFSVAP